MVIGNRNKSARNGSTHVIRLKGPSKLLRPLSPYSARTKLSRHDSDDVIDLGGPKKLRTKPRAPYSPSTRLYPGPQALKKKESEPKPHRKKRMRQPRQLVPNPRLYQPAPRRVVPRPPPLFPAVSWQPPMPTISLDTASGAALRLAETRKQSSQKLGKRRPQIKGQSETQRTHSRAAPRGKYEAWQGENPFLKSISVSPKIKQPAWLTSPSALGPYDDLI